MLRYIWRRRFRITVCALLITGLAQALFQVREDALVRRTAEEVVGQAGATTPREKAVALRDYLRRTVTYEGAPHDDRPFLRATAWETLSGRKGYCGEVTRAFIGLARAVDLPAQRINLYGRVNHVVAVADLGDGRHTLVDCQNPPTVAGLDPLDEVLRRPEFEDYSTLNVRRIGLGRVESRLKVDLGPLTYLTENPLALKAAACGLLAGMLVSARGLRVLLRWFLRARGWVHRSDVRGLRAAIANHPGEGNSSPTEGGSRCPAARP